MLRRSLLFWGVLVAVGFGTFLAIKLSVEAHPGFERWLKPFVAITSVSLGLRMLYESRAQTDLKTRSRLTGVAMILLGGAQVISNPTAKLAVTLVALLLFCLMYLRVPRRYFPSKV